MQRLPDGFLCLRNHLGLLNNHSRIRRVFRFRSQHMLAAQKQYFCALNYHLCHVGLPYNRIAKQEPCTLSLTIEKCESTFEPNVLV